MNQEFLKILLQFIQAMVNSQVDKKVKQGLTQGFVSLSTDEDLDTELENAKVQLAECMGCSVHDLPSSVA